MLLDRRTLLYLATNPDGSGPSLYSMDVERRIAHRLTPGLDRYTSLAVSADGRRLVVTLASPKTPSGACGSVIRLRPHLTPSPISLTHYDWISPGWARIISYMFPQPVRARASGNSLTECQPSFGAGRGHGSSAGRQSRPTGVSSHFQRAKVAGRPVRDGCRRHKRASCGGFPRPAR